MNIMSTLSTEEMSDLNLYNSAKNNESQLREQVIESRRRKCFGTSYSKFSVCCFEKDDMTGDTQSMKSIRLYSDNFEKMKALNKGLMIYGNVGVGKTFAACCVANAVIEQGYRCCMTDFSRIINAMWSLSGGKQDYIDSFNQYDLLIIDDLAAERDTDFSNEIVMNVINTRYNIGKPIIVTTNIIPKVDQDIRKQRIYSRLYEMCIPINFKGEDRRQRIMSEDYMKLKDLLQLTM